MKRVLVAGGTLVAGLVALIVVVSIDIGPRAELLVAQDDLNAHRRMWDERHPDSYRYEFSSECFGACTGGRPIIIHVNEDSVVRPKDNWAAKTVDKLFDMIQYAISESADHFEVSYDSTHGYPTAASIDYEDNAIDDEWRFTIGWIVPSDNDGERPGTRLTTPRLPPSGEADADLAGDRTVLRPMEPTRGMDAQSNLNLHRELWDSQEPFEYAIEYSSKCFGPCTPEPTEVVVEEGRVRSYGGHHVFRMDPRIRRTTPFHTVDELFDRLQYAIDKNAYQMDVVYNSEVGYPETADIDRRAHGVDDEWSFEITGYLDLDRDSEQFQKWTQFAKAVCEAWFDVTTDDLEGLIRAADTIRDSSPPDELREYRDWWLEALEATSPASDAAELVDGIVEKTAGHPLLYAVTMCDLPDR